MPGMPMPGMPGMMPGFPGMPGQQMMMGMPPMGFPGGPEPANKKAKTAGDMGGKLIPEAQWIATHPQPVNIKVLIPDEPDREWGFVGQTLEFTLPPTTSIMQMKNAVSDALRSMPTAKMKINIFNGTFLNKDKFTLAHYNINTGTTFQLGVRERGGRKK